MEDAVGQYLSALSEFPVLTQAEEQDLVVKLRSGSVAAKERLVCCNLKLVVNISRKYVNSGLPMEDLIQAGNKGLMEAVRDFALKTYTGRFTAYAGDCIRHEIVDTIRKHPKHELEDLDLERGPETATTDEFLERDNLVTRLKKVMDTLTPEECALLCRIAEGYRVSELGHRRRLLLNHAIRRLHHPSRMRILRAE